MLKVYLRLGWYKLNEYYTKLISVAYNCAVIMNPFYKLKGLKSLWS
jgi:hypothetical protein